jgi:predicted nucleic acid-binding protein
LTQATLPSTHVWNDAYLAAFAMAGNYEIATFDRGFAQFNLGQLTLLP